MEIKSFLLRAGVALSLVYSLVGCQALQTKQRSSKPSPPVVPVEAPQNPELQPTVETPQFLEKSPPKLGVILGPGGALSFSHIGFLQELENQKIQVHSIAGVEWGALIAGAYSSSYRAHAIEWKLLKLPFKKFNEKSFFAGKKSPIVNDFDDYLTKIFEDQTFRDLEIGFACPYVSLTHERFNLYTKGRVKNAVQACWPSSPHFQIQTVGADYSGVEAVANLLRSQGAELIVYVDVLTLNQLLTKKDRRVNPGSLLSLIQAKSLAQVLAKPAVDEIIRLPLNGQNINSYKSLRSIIRLGQIKSKNAVKELAQKYAY